MADRARPRGPRGDGLARSPHRAAVGAAVAQLVNILDPAAVVIGGGLGLCLGLYRDALLETARRHIWSDLHRELPMIQLVRQERFVAAKSYLLDFTPTVWGLYQPERIAIRP